MYTEPVPDHGLAAPCGEPIAAEPRDLWASELLEAGLIALMEAELSQSVSAALLAAELMDVGWDALGAALPCEAELVRLKAPDACRPSRAPRRA